MELPIKLKYILSTFFLFSYCLCTTSQNSTMIDRTIRYEDAIDETNKSIVVCGGALALDLFSPIQMLLSDYGGFQIDFSLNIKKTFFPTFEIGYGICNHKDGYTLVKYKTSAPFFKIGLDYNILKDKTQSNRMFVGCRYGFSNFKFNISGQEIVDPIWKYSEPFDYKNINTTTHWVELLAGVRVKIWRNIYMGWSIRYKKHISSSSNTFAEPYYIPGYGSTTNSSSWGGSYSIIYDLKFSRKRTTLLE